MDLNLVHLDWERIVEVLAAVVVLSFVIERALAVIFEQKLFLKHFDGKSVKELIAVVVSVVGACELELRCNQHDFAHRPHHVLCELLTGMVVADGSQASLKLFHDVLDIRSSAHEAVHQSDPATGKPTPLPDAIALAKL